MKNSISMSDMGKAKSLEGYCDKLRALQWVWRAEWAVQEFRTRVFQRCSVKEEGSHRQRQRKVILTAIPSSLQEGNPRPWCSHPAPTCIPCSQRGLGNTLKSQTNVRYRVFIAEPLYIATWASPNKWIPTPLHSYSPLFLVWVID